MMASWMNNLRALGGTRTNKNNNGAPNQNQAPPSRGNTSSPSSYGSSSLGPPNLQAIPASPSLSAIMTASEYASRNGSSMPSKTPIFFREEYAQFMVKGNFMTLAAKPHLIEEAEWLAHQTVEQNRLLSMMIKCVQGEERSSGRTACNEQTCPAMTAGSVHYPWIDTKGNPISIPAALYIRHIQTWVNGKILDNSLFPTDTFTSAPPLPNPAETKKDSSHWLGKTSGFSSRFETEVKNMFKQMFRCYAHLYWHHWLTFWDLSAHKDLNTCFMHFMNVGRLYDLLSDKDVEPMAPLIELWVKTGVLPAGAKADEGAKVAAAGGTPTSASAPTGAGWSSSAPTSATSATTAGGGSAGSASGGGVGLTPPGGSATSPASTNPPA